MDGEMSTLERLKQMEQAAREAADSDFDNTDERTDTAESFDFAYALQEAWPKLLAVVEAAEALSSRLEVCKDGEMDAWLKDILFTLNRGLREKLDEL